MSVSGAYLRKLDRQRAGSAFTSAAVGGSDGKRSSKAKQSLRLLSKATINGFVSKYQNRRLQLLKAVNPVRSPISISRLHSKTSIWCNCQRLRIYDIVSVVDSNDNLTKFYGQINAFVTDSYAKNYVFLVWLVPKSARLLPPPSAIDDATSSTTKFSPIDYVHGIADERPIPAECCTFESSCPFLPRYMRDWSREQLAQEKRRAELIKRVDALRTVAPPELPNPRDDFKKLA